MSSSKSEEPMDMEAIVAEVGAGKTVINWAVLQFEEDPKLLQLQRDSDLLTFLTSLEDSDPYVLRKVPAINGIKQLILMARGNKLPFMQKGVTEKQANDEMGRALARKQLDVYVEEYPWTKPFIDEGLARAEKATCHSCVEIRLVQEVAQMVKDEQDNPHQWTRFTVPKQLSREEAQALRPGYVFPDETGDEDMWGAREPCPLCTLKHLSQAIILINESLQGYPIHRWLAVGHMAEAEAEAPSHSMANRIRAQRLKAMDELEYIPYLTDILAELDAIVRS